MGTVEPPKILLEVFFEKADSKPPCKATFPKLGTSLATRGNRVIHTRQGIGWEGSPMALKHGLVTLKGEGLGSESQVGEFWP